MKIDINKIKESKSTEELLRFGIINIDKPSGPTSFSVSDYVRRTMGLNKTSHMGTLDPQVSGVLPIALGRACRLSEYLMHRNKRYIGIMRLHDSVADKELKETIKSFIGKIKQLPPVRSRVKRAVREREIISFNILEVAEKDILFETEVQAGTYIRKLCDDIGKQIGGAHMLELRRVQAGLFLEPSISLYDFDKAVEEYKSGDDKKIREIIIPGEIVANMLPVLQIEKQVIKKALTGSPIFLTFLSDKKEIKNLKEGDKISIFSDSQFIGCYNFIGKEDLVAKPEFVFN
ncbi:MAG: RNA-guided pseudouridylation complex pseudouridine synthase subunit Cbf5 [Nanoarchaeota archaeon]